MRDEADEIAIRSGRLLEFVLGQLSSDDHAALQREVDASDEFRAELAGIRRVIAGLDDLELPVEPSEALRRRVVALADPAARFEGLAARMSRLFDLALDRVREVLAAIGDPAAAWEESGIPGARLYHFAGGPNVDGADCGLVELAPGSSFPVHTHRGDEWCLNLRGCAMEDTGELFEPGDLIFRPDGSRHGFRSVGEEPYVFAVVLYGGFHPDAELTPRAKPTD